MGWNNVSSEGVSERDTLNRYRKRALRACKDFGYPEHIYSRVMSNRKFTRGAMRAYARKHGIKEGKYVRTMFNRLQVKKYGATVRKIHQATGSKPKRVWNLRIASALGK